MAIIKVRKDFASIQDAVNAASSGDIILVDEGIYHETVVISGKTNLNIIGKNAATTVLDGEFTLGTGFLIESSSNVKITCLSIRNYINYGVYIRSPRCTVSDCWVHDCVLTGVQCYDSNCPRVTCCRLYGNGEYGAACVQCYNFKVEENTVKGNGNSGVYLFSNTSGGDCSRNECCNNGEDGISILCPDVRCLCNEIRKNFEDGIRVVTTGDVLVQGNIVSQNNDTGISCSGGDCTVEDNKVRCNNSGVEVDCCCAVRCNVIENNSCNGLTITGSCNVVEDNKITGNCRFDICRFAPNNIFDDNVFCTSNTVLNSNQTVRTCG